MLLLTDVDARFVHTTGDVHPPVQLHFPCALCRTLRVHVHVDVFVHVCMYAFIYVSMYGFLSVGKRHVPRYLNRYAHMDMTPSR